MGDPLLWQCASCEDDHESSKQEVAIQLLRGVVCLVSGPTTTSDIDSDGYLRFLHTVLLYVIRFTGTSTESVRVCLQCVVCVSIVCRSCYVNYNLRTRYCNRATLVVWSHGDGHSLTHTHSPALFRPCAEQHARVRIVHSTQVCAVLICDLSHRMSKPSTMR